MIFLSIMYSWSGIACGNWHRAQWSSKIMICMMERVYVIHGFTVGA